MTSLLLSPQPTTMWQALVDWFLGLGADYGVDPIIFGSISVGAIPFFWASVAWLVRNLRRGRPIVLPVIATALCVLSAYVYLFLAGEGLPSWVYGAVAALIGYSAYSTWATARRATSSEAEDASDGSLSARPRPEPSLSGDSLAEDSLSGDPESEGPAPAARAPEDPA